MDEDDEASKLKNPIRGPLWISTGAWPVLDGMEGYLKKKLSCLKDHLKKIKQFKQDVSSKLAKRFTYNGLILTFFIYIYS